MAARVRQVQLLPLSDPPAGDARGARVRVRSRRPPDARAVDWPAAVLPGGDRAGICAGVAVVAVLRSADPDIEGAVSVFACQRGAAAGFSGAPSRGYMSAAM